MLEKNKYVSIQEKKKRLVLDNWEAVGNILSSYHVGKATFGFSYSIISLHVDLSDPIKHYRLKDALIHYFVMDKNKAFNVTVLPYIMMGSRLNIEVDRLEWSDTKLLTDNPESIDNVETASTMQLDNKPKLWVDQVVKDSELQSITNSKT